ncbi:hypothetical protein M5689_015321 [Euphorbia peplus]|nr:hypothetical protein M5689_015321 [Euphorbia peplus]
MKSPQLHPLQIFSTKTSHPSSSSTLSSVKIKTLIHTLIISHVCRIIRALSKAKSIFIHLIKENQLTNFKIRKHRQVFGSFRLHYNWCSSHVLPIPADSTWISESGNDESQQLSGYLQWLEEKVKHNENVGDQEEEIEIDQLADMFIASCHEKFRLEKQESYRRFQDMMARSM